MIIIKGGGHACGSENLVIHDYLPFVIGGCGELRDDRMSQAYGDVQLGVGKRLFRNPPEGTNKHEDKKVAGAFWGLNTPAQMNTTAPGCQCQGLYCVVREFWGRNTKIRNYGYGKSARHKNADFAQWRCKKRSTPWQSPWQITLSNVMALSSTGRAFHAIMAPVMGICEVGGRESCHGR